MIILNFPREHAPGCGHCVTLCPWARHFPLTVPLTTQVYKWIPADLMLGVTLQWTNMPSRGSRNTSSRLMLQKPGKAPANGPLGSYTALLSISTRPHLSVWSKVQKIWFSLGTCPIDQQLISAIAKFFNYQLIRTAFLLMLLCFAC